MCGKIEELAKDQDYNVNVMLLMWLMKTQEKYIGRQEEQINILDCKIQSSAKM